MKKAKVFVDGILAGHLIEWEKNQRYEFSYLEGYSHQSISLTMPLKKKTYEFDRFPPFFDGFLPEGFMLDALLRKTKIDSNDRFEQLVRVGGELVGNITVERDFA
jgi:serine/threonine-protein kinase HipA